MGNDDDKVIFSYATADDPKMKRWLIRWIEKVTGQPYLRSIYLDNKHNPVDGETFWQAVIRRLEINLKYNPEAAKKIPKTGPVVIISNHPYGVLDGMVTNHIASQVRDDYRILINSVLTQAEEVAHYMLPIDFSATQRAMQTNLRSRADAAAHLKDGGLLIAFPAGGVSTKESWFGPVTDLEWKPFTAKLIQQSGATVIPMYFFGQNSKLFQYASLISQTLRLSLFFKEVYDKIGHEIEFVIGDPIDFSQLEHMTNRQELIEHLRKVVYSLRDSQHLTQEVSLPNVES